MIQYQILRTNTIRIVWQIVRRVTNEILGVKGLIRLIFEHPAFVREKVQKCSIDGLEISGSNRCTKCYDFD